MAFITAETRSDLIALAVGMLNQAPGNTLLEELIALSVGGGTLADAADHIAKTDAFKAEYPSFQTAEQYAAEIFDNITTGGTVTDEIRDAVIDLATGFLTSGAYSKAGLALAMIDFLSQPSALLNADFADIAQSVQNRSAAAEYYVVTKELGGSTAAELAAAVASVTSDAATLTAANAAADATAAAVVVVPGQTYTLTTGLDTLVGGGANDTFSAVDSAAIAGAPTTTLNAGDSINAGAGTDRLSIAASTGSAVTAAAVSSSTVEEIALYYNSGAGYTVDASLMTGLTDLYVVGGNSTAAFTGVNSSPNVHLTSANNNVTVTNAATVGLGDADAVTIALNGASATASATLTYNDIETFNVVTSGAATGTATRSQSLVSDQLETVNVSGSAAANITATMTGAATVGAVGTLDASDMTGALVATVGAGASGVLSVTGGSGNDRLTVNGGAMNDDLTIDGGDGVDTLVVTSAAYDATSTTGQAGDGVTNMEVLMVSGSADVRSFSNNTFASFVGTGATAITGLGTAAASLTMLTTGNKSLARATDGAADSATVTFAGASEFTVATLGLANEETVTINSGSTVAGGAQANIISSLTGTDLTSLTIAGNRDLTISAITGTALATVDASGLTGLGTQLVISAANSEADMTVTGAAGVETTTTEVMNNITTGSGDDSITTGVYNDTINAGEGDNTVNAGDGDNVITVGRGDDTITAGDGDNTITSTNGDNTITVGAGDNTITLNGNGDDTVTAGGTTTSTTVFDTNTVNLGGGDDTYVGGAGKDNVTLGAGDDTVDTGAGNDIIIMTDYDDDDSINGGAGTDILYRDALPTTGAYAAAADFVDISGDSEPAFTGVETVYLQQTVAATNDGESTKETIDFTASSGITSLYLDVVDAEANDDAVLDIVNLDATNLIVSDTSGEAVALLDVDGAGQSSLTITFDDWNSSTADAVDLEVTDVDALTLTARTTTTVSGVTSAITMTAIDDVTADSVETLNVRLAAVGKASYSASFTVDDISADAASAMSFSAGTHTTLAVGAVTNTSANIDTLTLTASDDSNLNIESITMTGADVPVATITVGTGAQFENASNAPLTITADTITATTITVGAAAEFRADLDFGGVTTLTALAGSTVDIDNLGQNAETGSFTLSGRGTLTNDIAVDGTTTLRMSGWTDASSTDFIIDGTAAEKLTFVGNTLYSASVQGGAGNDSVTSGDGADEISLGAGADTVNAGAGNDRIGAEGGTQTLAITYGDNDAIVVTVNGVASASVTASNDDITTATNIAAAINAKSATNFATAAVDASNDVVITYDQYFTGATVTDNTGADGNDTVSVGTATGYSDAGDDVINLGDGVDYVYYNAGADKINTGGNDSDADIIYFQSDAADVAATWTDTAAGSTVDVSNAVIITGYTLDKLDLAASAGDFAAVNTPVETMVTSNDAIGNNDDVDVYTGVYNATTGLFTSAATASATDLLVIYDNDVSGTPDFSAIVLVGGVNSSGELLGITEASGVLTLGAWA